MEMFFRKPRIPARPTPAPPPADRYQPLIQTMLDRYQIQVRRWRTASTGCAWLIRKKDGTELRLLESPAPRGPVSLAIFLHEVGHHAIGFGRYRLRCHEEFKAWEWALNAMEQNGFPVTASVRKRVDRSLKYAVAKSLRRGLKALPAELAPYLPDHVHTAPLPHTAV